MFTRFDTVVWRARFWSGLAQLTTIFVGVTLAFVFEGYRKQIDERAAVRQAVNGIIFELGQYEERGNFHAEQFERTIAAWREADAAGRQAVPMLYRLPGALSPPTAAWTAAVSSGAANNLDPTLKLELGYFYSEFVGVHENYVRQVAFAEREIMPRAFDGAAPFYDASGKLRPEFRVHIALVEEFAKDLKHSSARAGELKRKLQQSAPQ